MAVWAVAVIAVAAVSVPVAVRNVRRSGGRWGDRLRVHEPESDGPYREGSTTERIARRAPLSVWAFAIVAPAWASVTLLVIAPIYGLFLFTGFCRNIDWVGPCEVPAALHVGFSVGGAVLVLSALVLAVRLIRDALSLPSVVPAALRACRITAIHCAVHHAAALAWWAVGSAAHDDFGALPVIVFPCALGVLVALLEWRASSHVARALAPEGAP